MGLKSEIYCVVVVLDEIVFTPSPFLRAALALDQSKLRTSSVESLCSILR